MRIVDASNVENIFRTDANAVALALTTFEIDYRLDSRWLLLASSRRPLAHVLFSVARPQRDSAVCLNCARSCGVMPSHRRHR